MLVVVAFLAGIGFGAALAGRWASQLKMPVLWLSMVEFLLCLTNFLVAILLSVDIGETVFTAQRFAQSLGVPLRFLYAVGAFTVLSVPTLLMGATIPLAAEVIQRGLGSNERRLIALLFVLNTGGAAVGAVVASAYLLPYYGQTLALGAAISCNFVAGIAVLLLWRAAYAPSPPRAPMSRNRARRISWQEAAGWAMGFLALGYEMLILRTMALAHGPLPYVFASVLFMYLFLWSSGVFLSSKISLRLSGTLLMTAAAVAITPLLYQYDRFQGDLPFQLAAFIYCLPCVGFGLLYGWLVSDAAEQWGEDIGRFAAINTIGSCCGVLFFTLVGYELSIARMSYLIALGLLFVFVKLAPVPGKRRGKPENLFAMTQLIVLGCAAILLVDGLQTSATKDNGLTSFWGRDGVIDVNEAGSVYIDGLWHTRLSDGTSHIGGPWSWTMAAAGVLAHPKDQIRDVLVVGLGVGLTATTLTGLDHVQVDVYEINHSFKNVLYAYPGGSLHVLDNPRVKVFWQDARSGLALNTKKYDLIISSPLELRQSGSSLLLSQEYFRLLRSRLKDDGVVALYSREVDWKQTQLVVNTVASVFSHTVTIAKGVVTLASNTVLDLSARRIQKRIATHADEPLYRQIAAYRRANRVKFVRLMGKLPDVTPTNGLIITDQHPLIEYPDVVNKLVGRLDE